MEQEEVSDSPAHMYTIIGEMRISGKLGSMRSHGLQDWKFQTMGSLVKNQTKKNYNQTKIILEDKGQKNDSAKVHILWTIKVMINDSNVI